MDKYKSLMNTALKELKKVKSQLQEKEEIIKKLEEDKKTLSAQLKISSKLNRLRKGKKMLNLKSSAAI